MSNVWVFKFDGSIQCDPESKEVSIEAMPKQLGEILGFEKIVSMKKATRPMIKLCGMPTGSINAYELTEVGWTLLNDGIAGTCGLSRLDLDTDEQASQAMQLGGRAAPPGGIDNWLAASICHCIRLIRFSQQGSRSVTKEKNELSHHIYQCKRGRD